MLYRYQKLLALYGRRLQLINRNYTFLWLGQSVSLIGDTIFDTVLVLWVAMLLRNDNHAPLAVSGIGLAVALPSLLLSPFAGVLVDRWSKQRTMLVMDALRALLVCCLLLVTGALPLPFLAPGGLPLPVKLVALYMIVAASSSCSQFFNPSSMALLGIIVPEEQRTRASALSMGTGMFAWTLGPAIASVLYASFGIGWAIVFNVASFGWSWCMIRRIQLPASQPMAPTERPQRHFLRELWDGLSFIRGNALLFVLLLADCGFFFGLGIVNTLCLFLVTGNLHVPDSLYGPFCAIPASGGILGTWLVGRYGSKVGETRIYAWAALLSGACILFIGWQSNPLLALFGFFIANVSNLHAAVVTGPLILKATPEALVGRIFAARGTAITVSSMLATFLSGYLSSTLLRSLHLSLNGSASFNAINVLYICAGIIIMLAGIYAWWKLVRKG
ncbi:MFS transporter [Dictyobacter formicarum]|uniref:MFS transporter n=1 Tax=Dictyobacter formicarum TaxID=2778368 RepID=A0ABQ3VTS4_9CHLR|nr:MFS transporter [Dictyobacter formicarum]GHO88706.1 MFS transporter [Dictyobacter formicarum]